MRRDVANSLTHRRSTAHRARRTIPAMRAFALAVLALTCVAARASNAEDAASAAVEDRASSDAFLRRALPLYRSRSAECVACQRALAYFDEHLMLALQDIVAEETRGASGRASEFATRYGRFESVIEEAVPAACFAGSIATNRTVRVACERMIERSEDAVVELYFRVGEALRRGEEEEELGEALCGANGAMMRGACEDDVARWKVSELELLEMESAKVSKKDFVPDEQAPGMPPVCVSFDARRVICRDALRERVTDAFESKTGIRASPRKRRQKRDTWPRLSPLTFTSASFSSETLTHSCTLRTRNKRKNSTRLTNKRTRS